MIEAAMIVKKEVGEIDASSTAEESSPVTKHLTNTTQMKFSKVFVFYHSMDYFKGRK